MKGAAVVVAAPAIVRAESLMKIWVPPAESTIITWNSYGLFDDDLIDSAGSGRTILITQASDPVLNGQVFTIKSVTDHSLLTTENEVLLGPPGPGDEFIII